MHQLLLLRHAKSSRDDSGLPDRDRPLSPRGWHDAGSMRAAMRRLGLVPDVVLVSPARRTMQTLEALEPWDDTLLVEPIDALYLAGVTQLLAALHGVAETVRSVLVIGHNPGMHELAVALAGTRAQPQAYQDMRRLAEGYPTGALAELTVGGPWRQLDTGGARLTRFLTPRELDRAV